MKSSTENIYKQKVNQVIDYINFNLHQPLQLNVIAGIVNMSQRQLLRMMTSENMFLINILKEIIF